MERTHDTQVGWQVLVQNLDVPSAVAADNGYDWEILRTKLRAEGVTPLTPTGVTDLRRHVRNLFIDKSTYHRRSNAESGFFELRRRYGDALWSRTWFGQYRERAVKSAVRNIERAIEGSHR